MFRAPFYKNIYLFDESAARCIHLFPQKDTSYAPLLPMGTVKYIHLAAQGIPETVTQSNFIEIALRHGCSPVNFLHTFRTPFPRNTSEGMFYQKTSKTFLDLIRFLSFTICKIPSITFSMKNKVDSSSVDKYSLLSYLQLFSDQIVHHRSL